MSAPVSNFKVIGRRLATSDGFEKVTGRIRYVADTTLPNMLHARLVLSPYAHAHIVSLDSEAARAVPGVVAVLTAGDLPTRDRTPTNRNSLILARERVIFCGQPVVAVLAETEVAAQDAANLVAVEYDPLPAVIDPLAAMAEDAPLVWPNGVPKGEGASEAHAAVSGASEGEATHGNIASTVHFIRGDVQAGFRAADAVVERTYRTGIVHQAYLEPHAAMATVDPVTDELIIYTSTQGQFMVREEVAKILKRPESRVRVVPMKVGGGFGAKYGILEPLVAALAIAVGRPVRLVLTRNEDLLTTTPTPASVIEIKAGARRDGSVTALQARVILDNGVFPFGLLEIVCNLVGGYYRFPNLDIRGYEVLTNKPQIGAYRAPGAPQATFAIESQMDDLARELGLDPLQFRLRNAVTTSDFLPGGSQWAHIGLKECLERAASHPLWLERGRKTDARLHGVGLAVGGWFGGTTPAAAICRPDADGTINVHVGTIDISGSNSSMQLLAAEALGVRPENVRIISGDTGTGPFGPNSGGSQVLYTAGVAVVRAAEEARRQILAIAAELFEANVSDLEINDGQISVRGVPTKRMAIGEVVKKTMAFEGKYAPIAAQGGSANPESAPGFTVQLAEVDVAPDTGAIHLLRNVIIQDVGRAINPMMVEGQMHGGATQGIGFGLSEELVYDEAGTLLTGTLLDYTLPRAAAVPSFETVMVDNPAPYGPFGARGVGEPAIIAGAAAIANAVRDATGVRLTELPMRPERVWKALRQRMR